MNFQIVAYCKTVILYLTKHCGEAIHVIDLKVNHVELLLENNFL